MDATTYKLLKQFWNTFVPQSGVSDLTFEHLIMRYEEDHRFYHTPEHIYGMLYDLETEFKYPVGVANEVRSHDALFLAAFYHDCIYDPTATGGANEKASAKIAYDDILTLEFSSGVAQSVADLIMVTWKHEPCTPEEILLVDADFGIFKESPALYNRYAADIRKEYKHVNDENYAKGRGDFLRSLLSKEHIFHNEGLWFYEDQARANIERELHQLVKLAPIG